MRTSPAVVTRRLRMKRLTSIRLSELTDRQLTDLAQRLVMSQSEVISIAIDRMYQMEVQKMVSLPPMTDDEIEEELRQLELEDGEEVEYPDTQFSDYPTEATEEAATE